MTIEIRRWLEQIPGLTPQAKRSTNHGSLRPCVVRCALLLGVSACAPTQRALPPSPMTSAHSIAVRPTANGLNVRYSFPRAASIYRFNKSGLEIRKDTWKVRDGLSITAEGITATTPVSEFDVTVAPDSRQRDRVYPALTQVGAGWLIYAPHLRPEDSADHLTIDVPPSWSVVGHRTSDAELVGDGYIFAGPSSYIHHGAAVVITAPTTPIWLLREIENAVATNTAFYTHKLGVALQTPPTIFVTLEPAQNGSFHGDTTKGAMMSLRFYGAQWNGQDVAPLGVLSDFVQHELFHFWNEEYARSSQGDTHPWLHEGAANYAALIASRERGRIDDTKFVATLNRHLERCQNALKDRDLRAHGPKSGSDVYACGTVLHWAFDLGLRKRSDGKRDVFTWWSEVFSDAKRHGGTYSLESAATLAGNAASQAANLLLDSSDAQRWDRFAAVIQDVGTPMVRSRAASQDQDAALSHILQLHCGKKYGYFTLPNHVKLDTGADCGVLSGSPDIDQVAGSNPVTEASAMHDGVRQLCASNRTVEFAWKGKIVAAALCTKALPEPTLLWKIRQ